MNLAGKKVLLTGGNGFLGSHIHDVLLARGVRNEDITITLQALCDLTRRENVEDLFLHSDHGTFDLVIHCAARMGGIGDSSKHPGAFFYENLMMGAHVIEEARLAGVKKVVLIGSICSYPKYADVPFREDDLWNGLPEETNAAYGLAKRMLIVQAQAYRQEYNLNAITLIPANLYGPRDNFDLETSHVIPALIRKIAAAKKKDEYAIPMWGDGWPTREFLFVEDAAEAVVLAAEHYDEAPPVNLGTGSAVSIRQLTTMVAAIMDYRGDFIWDDTKTNGQPFRRLEVTRAQDKFGFKAKVSLHEGLRRTIDWWRQAPFIARIT